MTTEIWLRPNRRAIYFGMVPPAVIVALGALLVFGLPGWSPPTWLRVLGGILAIPGIGLLVALLVQLRRPRVAFADGHLLLALRSGAPIRVPIHCVECFLIGKSPSLLPGKGKEHIDATSISVRIAESASEWQYQPVKPQLGAWCGGYVTIRGTWCEPLNLAVVNRLNERLAEVSRATTAQGGDAS